MESGRDPIIDALKERFRASMRELYAMAMESRCLAKMSAHQLESARRWPERLRRVRELEAARRRAAMAAGAEDSAKDK